MIKKILAGICLTVTTVTFSQQNNASPYSYYGIGDIKFKGTVENRSMGELGILPDSIHVNLQNPAMYSALKFTTYTVGGSTSQTNFKTSDEEDKAGRTTFDYLAVALPFNKVGVAFGIMPYSSVGYRIENTTESTPSQFRRFTGSGGLNRVFLGASYKITPKFSFGADFQYNFGDIETKSIVSLPDVGTQYPTREVNTSDYSGISFNIGAVYQTRLNQKYDWVTSASFAPEAELTAKTQRTISTVSITTGGNEVVIDEIEQIMAEDKLRLPSKWTFGTGFGEARKWFAGAEYTFRESAELGNRFNNTNADNTAAYETAYKMTLGGYYIPNYNSYNSYFKRMTYRAGLKYEKTGLVINNESINDYSVSLGLGFPLSNLGSNLNIGVEMGRRGTTTAGLVEENYTNVFISLSINDKWFAKRRFE